MRGALKMVSLVVVYGGRTAGRTDWRGSQDEVESGTLELCCALSRAGSNASPLGLGRSS